MKINLPVTQNELPFPKERYLVSKTDLAGIITYANEAFIGLSGFSREELLGQNHNIVRHPDMPAQAFEDLWRTIQSGRPWRGVVKNRAKNGDYYWVDAFIVPVHKQGVVNGYMSVRSAPDRKQIAAAEALFRKLKASKAPLPAYGARLARCLNLKTRLAAVMSMSAALVVIAALVGLHGMQQSNQALEDAQRELFEPQLAIQNILALMDGSYKHAALGVEHDPATPFAQLHDHPLALHLDKLTGKIQEMDGLRPVIGQHPFDPEGGKLLDAFNATVGRYVHEGLQPVAQALRTGDYQTAAGLLQAKIAPLYEEAKAGAQRLDRHIRAVGQARRMDAANRYQTAVYSSIGITLGGLLFMLALSQWQARAIIQPMRQVIGYANRIANGVLTDEMEIGRVDEFGDVYHALAAMQVHLKVMLDNIREAVLALQQNSADLDAQMYMVAMQSSHQQSQVESVVATTEEFSQSVAGVAEHAGQMAQAADGSQRLVAECNATMSQSMTANAQVVDAVGSSSQTIAALSQSIQKIGEVTSTIRGIADQTNLLALNAAIEAARAGESGRGFAVVADEVRKLAVHTASSTSDITAIVEDIQRIAGSAVLAMRQAVAEVDQGAAKMHESVAGLSQITEASGEVRRMSQHIADAANEQAMAAQAVAGSMENVATLVEQNTQVAQQASHLSKDLMQTAERMKVLVGEFQLFAQQAPEAKAATEWKPSQDFIEW